MQLEKISLFSSKRDFFLFLFVCGFIFTYALLIEYNNYKNLTKFDSQLINATILKQYTKNKITPQGKKKTVQILKLKSPKNFSFYTTVNKKFPYSKGKKVDIVIWAGKISFYEYLTSFYSYSQIKYVDNNASFKENINAHLGSIHKNQNIANIYQALYTASPMSSKLQEKLSTLGISHLLAISGFHLGILSGLLFFLFKTPYHFLQNRYFPYRSYKVDSFIVIAISLLVYLLFLDSPASLLRAYVMLLIGFILYDRGFKIISMWTLFLTAIIIISFTPRLFFSLGFWFSISGVFYIFLFLIHFKDMHKLWQFLLVPIWVYLMMLPISLFVFENFSLYHPLSIVLTSLFTIFYPLSILLHFIGFGTLLDSSLLWIFSLTEGVEKVTLSLELIFLFILFSLLSVYKKSLIYLILALALSIFTYAIYNVA